MDKLAGIDAVRRLVEEQAAELGRSHLERLGRLQLADLSGGLPVAGALDNAAEILDSVRSLEDLLALFGVLPSFMREMASELRADFHILGEDCPHRH